MYYKSTSVPRIMIIIGIILLIPVIVFVVRAQPTLFSEPTYYSNPHVLYEVGLIDEVAIGGYIINRYDEKLYITNDHIEVEVSLHNYNDIRSLHMSHDQRYLAFDIVIDDGVKMFVVNLETGESENISETIGYLYDYDGYKVPYGLAWSPNQNIIAFVGGYHGSPRVRLYHLDMDLHIQSTVGSEAFPYKLYGVKWDINGESIYYVVDNFELIYYETYVGDEDYILYQTEITANDFLAGGKIEKIDELTTEEFTQWLQYKGDAF